MHAKEGTEKQTKKQRPTAERRGTDSRALANAGPEPPARKKAKPPPRRPPLPLNAPPRSNPPLPFPSAHLPIPPGSFPPGKYPWKTGIVTTTFWVGEEAARNNPVANHSSSWDPIWGKITAEPIPPIAPQRDCFLPAHFVPQQNPFYVALPYNDVSKGKHKPEAASVIPWFAESFERDGKTVLKDRWIAIRHKGRTVYAQWEDCGPFRTDHSAYVFGTERPKPNLNKCWPRCLARSARLPRHERHGRDRLALR